MSTTRLLAMGLLLALVPGCHTGGAGAPDGGGEMTIVVSADAHIKDKEKRLSAQRTRLDAERKALLAERAKLISEIKGGASGRTLLKLQQTLLDRARQLDKAQDALDQERAQVAREKDALLGQASPREQAASLDAREAAVARREADVSRREKDVARREKAVAEREARLAQREEAFHMEESLPPLVAPTANEPGRRVSRTQVEAAHRALLDLMQNKGILPSDLPPDVRASERRYYLLARKGRWAQALDAATTVENAVGGIKIDEAFIQAKMARLNALRGHRKLSPDQSKQMQRLLAKATSAFADGHQAAANLQLNQMFAILGR